VLIRAGHFENVSFAIRSAGECHVFERSLTQGVSPTHVSLTGIDMSQPRGPEVAICGRLLGKKVSIERRGAGRSAKSGDAARLHGTSGCSIDAGRAAESPQCFSILLLSV
jgi:hypothetical protein